MANFCKCYKHIPNFPALIKEGHAIPHVKPKVITMSINYYNWINRLMGRASEKEMLSRSPPAQQSTSDVVWLLVHTLNSIRTLHSYISKQEGRRKFKHSAFRVDVHQGLPNAVDHIRHLLCRDAHLIISWMTDGCDEPKQINSYSHCSLGLSGLWSFHILVV